MREPEAVAGRLPEDVKRWRRSGSVGEGDMEVTVGGDMGIERGSIGRADSI